MLYVSLCKQIAGTEQISTERRMEWEWPEDGPTIIGEYWLQTNDPAVIVIFETDQAGDMMMASAAWADVFEITIVPAVAAEEGLELVRMMNPG